MNRFFKFISDRLFKQIDSIRARKLNHIPTMPDPMIPPRYYSKIQLESGINISELSNLDKLKHDINTPPECFLNLKKEKDISEDVKVIE